ncbi:MAG: hypothetical protein A4E69_00046 [Syntrophus sp. PtaB.Bin138]|nr:MAG: hypothetical protein A4E69_00046 [Syntrophus sp. PtaB.Bin138]
MPPISVPGKETKAILFPICEFPEPRYLFGGNVDGKFMANSWIEQEKQSRTGSLKWRLRGA